MSRSKHIDKICIAAIAIVLVFTIFFMSLYGSSLQSGGKTMAYETNLFDTSTVHEIDIVMDDWDTFIENCESEEYSACTAVIDGEKYSNIGIRAKGNTSLSSVSSMDSQRYSFKLEFDQYESGKNYCGLDKLCLNNIIQDNTMMKDYLVYQMMNDFGVEAPLCSFVYITVNGEDWGLYLAVEAVEDSFLARNYGSDIGDLYKPDSMSMGGGRGNGREFDIEEFREDDEDSSDSGTDADSTETTDSTADTGASDSSGIGGGMQMPGGNGGSGGMQQGGGPGGGMPGEGQMPAGDQMYTDSAAADQADQSAASGTDAAASDSAAAGTQGAQQAAEEFTPPDGKTDEAGGGQSGRRGGGGGFNFGSGGMGSDDVKLKYTDDDPDSYSNIFGNAKTDVTDADQERLIAALKDLNEYTNLEETVDIEEVIRYFVVHNFVCNGDSYTGQMIHNYYLHEDDGMLSMIPWDYNLAFGAFQSTSATDSVNESIDEPVSGGDVDDRPMVGWIFSDETYTEQYHELFAEFIERWFSEDSETGHILLADMIRETADLIRPYVEKDPTKFCTAEEFETGVSTLTEFVTLRAEAVSRQLEGDSTQVDAGDMDIDDMGSMGNHGGGNEGGDGGNISGKGGHGDFDIASLVTLTDESGNTVTLTELIGEDAEVVSFGLSDGTEVDVSSDFRNLMQIDINDLVSVTDRDGNVTDLTDYTIALNMPSGSGGRNRGSERTGQEAVSQETTGDAAQTAEGGDSDRMSEDAYGGMQQGGGPGRMPEDAYGGMQQGGGPGRMSGDAYGGMQQGGGPGQMPGDAYGGMPGEQQAGTSLNTGQLVGASFIVIAAGILIAMLKKKKV